MKLRNKETGGLANLIADKDLLRVKTDAGWADYKSLAELNEDWEDYEEPKEYWSIDQFGDPINVSGLNSLQLEKLRRIGDLFQTKEEAEKAVEKLKAWKRLKDKGFRFILDEETEMPMFIYSGANGEKCITNAEESKQCRSDIKLLCGGEE